MAFIRKLLQRRKRVKPKNVDYLKEATRLLKEIDSELALAIRDSMCLAYGLVNYGFGVDKQGGVYVVICTEFALTNKIVVIDEFTVDIDFKGLSKKDILLFLTKQINNELKRVYLDSIYA